MTISRLPHNRWFERIQCADGSLFGRCTTCTYTWIARQSGDVNRYVQEEKTFKILNALKYAASPPASQDEKVRTGVNLAVNGEVAVCNLDECRWEHWVWNHFTPAPAEYDPT